MYVAHSSLIYKIRLLHLALILSTVVAASPFRVPCNLYDESNIASIFIFFSATLTSELFEHREINTVFWYFSRYFHDVILIPFFSYSSSSFLCRKPWWRSYGVESTIHNYLKTSFNANSWRGLHRIFVSSQTQSSATGYANACHRSTFRFV